jgi:hypothetical protein
MNQLNDLMAAVVIAVLLLVAGWFGIHHYGAQRYDAGYTAAVAAGQAQHEHDVADARKTEADLRAQFRAADADHYREEQEHAQALQAAQRRIRAGTDSLHCPAANPVHEASPASDRPAAVEPTADGIGPSIVPETAADLLGIGASVAGLVSRYEQVVDRFEACRAVNAQ